MVEGFINTEIGVIPNDWEVKTLGDVGEVKMCRRIFNHETKTEGTIPFFKIGTFGKEADAYITQDLYNNYRKRFSFPKKGDILISAAGTIGRTLIYDGKPAYFQDSNIVWIDNNETLISNEFLYYIFQVVKYNTEGGTIQRLYNSILRNTKFSYPTKTEQTTIATALKDADKLINQLEQLLTKKQNIKTGAMQELLKPKEGWEVKMLGEVVDFFKGKGLSKSLTDYEGAFQCLLYGELFTTYKEVINFVLSRTNKNEGLLSRNGDILMPGSTTTIGIDLAKASTILIDNVLLGGDINVLRKKGKCDYNSIFLTYYLNVNCKLKIAEKTKGVTIYHLQGKELSDIIVSFPNSKSEQNHIAQILSDMDNEIQELERKIAKYKMMKQGMMQSLLTGKIRLV